MTDAKIAEEKVVDAFRKRSRCPVRSGRPILGCKIYDHDRDRDKDYGWVNLYDNKLLVGPAVYRITNINSRLRLHEHSRPEYPSLFEEIIDEKIQKKAEPIITQTILDVEINDDTQTNLLSLTLQLYQLKLLQIESLKIIARLRDMSEFFHSSLFLKHLSRFSNLDSLRLSSCNIDEVQFKTLLFFVLPNLPQLKCLNLKCNNIKSVRSIAQGLKNCRLAPNLTLRFLDLDRNPIWKKIANDPEEAKAMCVFLRAFPTILRMGWCFEKYRPCGDFSLSIIEVEHELMLNFAGRSLVERVGMSRPLPLSVWPTVFERLNRAIERNLEAIERNLELRNSGLYYLLRTQPFLVGGR